MAISINSIIDEEVAQFTSFDNGISSPKKVGMFLVEDVNSAIQRSRMTPDPISLWENLWFSGEVHCLFSTSGLGKSIYAAQIAQHIAQDLGHKVVYADFELTNKQYEKRYTNKETGNLFQFSDNFIRVMLDPSDYPDEDKEDAIIKGLEEVMEDAQAECLIVDNITYICGEGEKGKVAVSFMKRLLRLKKVHGYSVLVIAHTPKRSPYLPLMGDDLAGSKNLFNFFDSVTAIGMSSQDEKHRRYIKQLKARYGEATYTSDNVLVCDISQTEDGFVYFKEIGTEPERMHLKPKEYGNKEELEAKVRQLASEGMTQNEIAMKVGISKSSVCRYLNK